MVKISLLSPPAIGTTWPVGMVVERFVKL